MKHPDQRAQADIIKDQEAEKVWIHKPIYDEAETIYYEGLSKATTACAVSVDIGAIKFLEKKVVEFEKTISEVLKRLSLLETKVSSIEKNVSVVSKKTQAPACENKNPAAAPAKKAAAKDDDDEVDLFGSDSEDDEAANKIKEERLAAYHAKKAKKPVLIAKSNVILDVKTWDDETDMKAMEAEVRKIETDGLLWGAAKLVPLAYGIHKLQISCVVEDDKVSIDWLQEQIESLEDYVQSVDIAAFNKI